MTLPLRRWTRRFDSGELVLSDARGQERADLDSGKTRTTADAALAPPPTLDGVVRRSDGRGTVWINGKPEQRRVGATLRTPVQDAAGNWSTPKIGEAPAGAAIRIQRGDR